MCYKVLNLNMKERGNSGFEVRKKGLPSLISSTIYLPIAYSKREHFRKAAGSSVTKIPLRSNQGNTSTVTALPRWGRRSFPDSTSAMPKAVARPQNRWRYGYPPSAFVGDIKKHFVFLFRQGVDKGELHKISFEQSFCRLAVSHNGLAIIFKLLFLKFLGIMPLYLLKSKFRLRNKRFPAIL